MTKKVDAIKSLDELSEGDVVSVSPHRQGPYVVIAIGEVPEHEKEAVFSRVVSPGAINGSTYRGFRVKESEVNRTSRITKLNKVDYSGSKYLLPRTI